MAAFRPLQPAPMDEDMAPQPQSRPMLTQKPKRTVTLGACVACRKRKSKCDGNRPVCTCCAQKDTGCVYELGPNEKPSQAMKRKNEEMQGELSNLRHLYDFLRLRPEHEAMEVLKRIRANPADTPSTQRIQELADFVRHGDMTTQQPPHSRPPLFQSDSSKNVTLPPLRLALDSSNNIDPQLFSLPSILPMGSDGPATQKRRYSPEEIVPFRSGNRVSLYPSTSMNTIPHPYLSAITEESSPDPRYASARHWTALNVDAHLLTRILSSWNTREYSFYHYLDKDAFLDDMHERRTDFCSELLVNALCATAACTCPDVVDRSKPFKEDSIMTSFYREAKRLWQLEAGKDSLTRLQAGICLFMFLGKQGRDKAGHPYLAEACRIGLNMGFYQPQQLQSAQSPYSATSERWAHVRAVSAWALFNFQLLMSFLYRFPAIIKTRPSMAIPYHQAPEAEGRFRSECLKSLILSNCNVVVQYSDDSTQRPRPPLSSQDVDAWYHDLSSWWDARPKSLHPDYEPSQPNLICAMLYHTNVIDIFQPFLNHTTAPPGTLKAFTERAQQITSSTLKEIRRLLIIQDLRHGWNLTIAIILHPLSVAAFGTLNEISQVYSNPIHAEGSEPYQGLLVCLRALCIMASYNYYGQPLFRLVTQKCQSLNFRLPAELQGAVDAYTSDEWTRAAAALVSSQYIADIRRLSLNADSARMDAIVSAWEGLSLDDDREKRAASS